MKLTKKQLDKLWGEDGPYSEINLKIQTRILDDSVSRIFLEVDANINPLTFEIVKKNRLQFADDIMIQQLLDSAKYIDEKYGYAVSVYSKELKDGLLEEAQDGVEYTKMVLIKMHRFVMDLLDIK